MTHRFFEAVDLSGPDELSGAAFESGCSELIHAEQEVEADITLHEEDIKLIQECAKSGGPKTRKLAVSFMFDNGPCSWEDLESWALDPNEGVRGVVTMSVDSDFDAGGKLCCLDKPRCIRLLIEGARRYPDDWRPEIGMQMAATTDQEWLELTWEAANELLEDDDPELNDALYTSYFEHVIPDLGWGPDDPHIRSWVSGTDTKRQRILLLIGAYCGLDEGRMRDIVQALTCANDKEIAATARGILDGRVAYGSF